MDTTITTVPYPGTPLRVGSRGASVTLMQRMLNRIATVYTAINTLGVDGIFGTQTKNATVRFQKQFSLNPDGVIGPATWNKINAVYEGVSSTRVPVTTPYGGTLLRSGSSGDSVRFVQSYVSLVGRRTGLWAPIAVDGRFGPATTAAVRRYQSYAGVSSDGIVGSITWNALRRDFNNFL